MATMFPCPSCGGQLRFDIENQKLKCLSCGSFQSVKKYTPNDKINFDKVYTKIYTCPTCAGQIQLIDNDGMEFCPFCGNQATMQEHFSEEGAPHYILPFKITREDAKKKYVDATKNVAFAPDGLDKKENVEKLVGLYTPYFLYDYTIADDISYNGVHVQTRGQYEYTEKAKVTVKVNVPDIMVPFDGSQSLDDSMAERLEPFPMTELTEFNPNYLAGFFVENSSVEKDLYRTDSDDKVKDYLYDRVVKKSGEYKPEGSYENDIRAAIDDKLQFKDIDGAYLPLYFMTTRYKDRVAYSIINGASGNTYVDVPIDKKKMFKSSVIVSAIAFIILLIATYALGIGYDVKRLCDFGAFSASLIGFIGAYLAYETFRHDNHLDDKGYFATKESSKGIKPKKGGKKWVHNLLAFLAVVCIALIAGVFFVPSVVFAIIWLLIRCLFAASFVLIVLATITVKQGKKTVYLLSLISWIAAVALKIMDLPSDIYYYFIMAAVFVVILISISAIVNEYNRFATHPSPQFMKKGGGLENA